MTRVVLLDTDMLISAFDRDQDKPIDIQRRERVKELASDPDTRFRITPLIFYEALRNCADLAVMEKALNDLSFRFIEVSEAHGRRAAEAYRWAKDNPSKGYTLDKRSFDLFHCVCEEVNNVELVSDDNHIPKIKQLLNESRQQ
jgi:hypothetical protein